MADEPEPTFEEALTQVERIVADLERGEPGLSAALAKYEDGMKILRRCYSVLEQAERAVAILTGVDEQGNPLTAPFDATATLSREPESTSASNTVDPKPIGSDRKPTTKTRTTAGDRSSPVPDPPF
jgi:exodeoxyribonuclease VII small subunit